MAPTGTTPQDDKGLSVVSKKWDADNKGFLSEEERALRNLDTEGTGTLTAKQLSSFTDQYAALRKENKQIKRRLTRLTVTLVVAFALTIALMITVAVLASRLRQTDVDSESGVMMAKGTDTPVSVKANEVSVPLAALPFLPYYVVEHVTTIDFTGADGWGVENSTIYHRSVAAIDIVSSARLVITTTVGDTLVWPSADGDEDELTVTLADGTSMTQSSMCSKCAATNVLFTEEIEQGVDAFAQRMNCKFPGIGEDDEGRRLCPLCVGIVVAGIITGCGWFCAF
jgi:hypothetical protein